MYTSTAQPQLGAAPLYSDGRRFSLAGWSAAEWATFFGGAAAGVSQVYGTVTHSAVPAAPLPTPQVRTPIGSVPTYAIVLGALAVGVVLLTGRKH